MKILRILSAILLLLAATSLHAQGGFKQFINIKTDEEEVLQNQSVKTEESDNAIFSQSSSVISPFMSKSLKRKGDMTQATERYYANITRQYGWYIGVGKPLSKAEAQKSGHYYRLSDKNDKGRWQRVDYVCNDPNLNEHNRIERLGSLIATQFDGDSRKHEIINSAVSWQFVSDPTGARMLEGRGFDSDGNLLYVMNSTEYSEGRFVLSFIDSFGLPMFPNRTLHVLCDAAGRFNVINFTDDAGYYFPNAENVYEIHIDYSRDGYRYVNCNIAGNPL